MPLISDIKAYAKNNDWLPGFEQGHQNDNKQQECQREIHHDGLYGYSLLILELRHPKELYIPQGSCIFSTSAESPRVLPP